ncbi:MAG: class I adenylate-forming enzyme family protein [Solirubrobacteraceae bacterium]
MNQIGTTTTTWGETIGVEEIGGVPFRVFTDRPRRVEELLTYTERWGSGTHIVQGDSVTTFSDLQRLSSTKARVLADHDIANGDRVLILGWNSPDWIINFWACLLAGAVPVLANTWWSELELADALVALTPALTLADNSCGRKLPAGTRRGPWETHNDPPRDLGAHDGGASAHDENEPATIIFTSGSEGRPKAVVLSHRSLLAGLQMLLSITRRLPHQLDGPAGDIGLQTGPLFHIGGVQTLLRAVMIGGVVVMPEGRYDPGEVLALIEAHKVTRWSAVPTMVSRLLEHPDLGGRNLETLRSLTVGGAPVHAELLAQIRAGLPSVQARVSTGYGLTENGGQATAASGRETSERPGASGRALPCVELKSVPRAGLPDGEILVRSPTQMSGYYGTEASPIDAEGWLQTGDLGRVDDDGHLWITGRSKDVIIRGGENIAPAAVEAALTSIDGVVEAAVFGVPNADLGEEVMAVVVLDRDLCPDALRGELRSGRLASFAVPTRWRLQRESLPLNHAGKVDKPVIVADARAALAAEQG